MLKWNQWKRDKYKTCDHLSSVEILSVLICPVYSGLWQATDLAWPTQHFLVWNECPGIIILIVTITFGLHFTSRTPLRAQILPYKWPKHLDSWVEFQSRLVILKGRFWFMKFNDDPSLNPIPRNDGKCALIHYHLDSHGYVLTTPKLNVSSHTNMCINNWFFTMQWQTNVKVRGITRITIPVITGDGFNGNFNRPDTEKW